MEMYWELLSVIHVVVVLKEVGNEFGDCFMMKVKVLFPERSNQHEYTHLYVQH